MGADGAGVRADVYAARPDPGSDASGVRYWRQRDECDHALDGIFSAGADLRAALRAESRHRYVGRDDAAVLHRVSGRLDRAPRPLGLGAVAGRARRRTVPAEINPD